MGSGIKFSIITCAYNSVETIMHSVQSVLTQTYENYELIILENNSSDGKTQEYIRNNIDGIDSRIKVIYSDNNFGWAHGTAICMDYATGEYMTMLAADDFFVDNEVLEHVAKDAESSPDIIFIGVNRYNYDYKKKEYYLSVHAPLSANELINDTKINQIYTAMTDSYYNSMFHFEKISFLKTNNIDFYSPYYGDCCGMTEALAKAYNVIFSDKALYGLTHNTSQTRGAVVNYNMGLTQWNSVINAIVKDGAYNSIKLGYIAFRILTNVTSQIEGICKGATIRDTDMHNIELNLDNRRTIIKEWIDNYSFRDMLIVSSMYFSGEFTELIENLEEKLEQYSLNFDEDKNLSIKLKIRDYYGYICRNLEYAYHMKTTTDRKDYLFMLDHCLNLYERISNHLSESEINNVLQRLKCLT